MVTVVVPVVLLAVAKGTGFAESGQVLTPAQWILGGCLAVGGLVLVAGTVVLFHRHGGTLAPWDAPRRLVVRGPYCWVRNPMILGVAGILLAEALLAGSWLLGAWFAFFSLANAMWIPLVEEPGLERRFGEAFREYKAAVPRWLPRLRPWRL